MRNRLILFGLVVAALLSLAGPALHADSKEQVLYSFEEDDNGAYPEAGVIRDSQGNLYGTANLAGADGGGTVFELTPHAGGWTFTLLHTFDVNNDGGYPRTGLLLDKSGNLYGTTSIGGPSDAGTLFELSPNGGGWTYQVIHDFDGTDGDSPSGDLVSDGKNTLYGVTGGGGGSKVCTFGCGTVFQLKRVGSAWKYKILYAFQGGADGSGPIGTLARDRAGNFYGMTALGGSAQCSGGCGTAFKLSLTAKGKWKKTTLPALADKKHGWFPYGGLTFGRAGNLYGTTGLGGNLNCNPPNGCGIVFQLTPQGKEDVIHRFTQSNGDGSFPGASLILAKGGRLYGSTQEGGQNGNECSGCGTVFEVAPGGKVKTIYAFKGSDGAMPQAPLFWDGDSNLYGTTFEGGSGFTGTVFELAP